MKFIKWLLFVVLLLLVLTGALLVLFPAKTAIGWMGGRLGPLQLHEVGGTIWNGHAGRAEVRGKPIGRIGWKVSPFSVLRGAAEAELRLDGDAFRGSTWARVTGPLSAELREFVFDFPAQQMSPALDVPGLTPVGTVEVRLPRAEIVSGYPKQLNGEAVWRGAAVAGEAAAALGDLRAEFSTTADGAITGILSDLGGPLSLEGSFRIAFTGYEAEAILSARNNDPALRKALTWIGEVQPDGSSYLKITGRLLPMR